MARNRLLRELKEIQKANEPDIMLEMVGDTIEDWRAVIAGPPGSPYESGKFELSIKCSTNYPMSPPLITFKTPVFHPNIHFQSGEICLDILKSEWSPAWSLQTACRAIISLLTHHNADSPLNCDAGNLIRCGDLRGFISLAKFYTIELAT